jgi:hypothetical protein
VVGRAEMELDHLGPGAGAITVGHGRNTNKAWQSSTIIPQNEFGNGKSLKGEP